MKKLSSELISDNNGRLPGNYSRESSNSETLEMVFPSKPRYETAGIDGANGGVLLFAEKSLKHQYFDDAPQLNQFYENNKYPHKTTVTSPKKSKYALNKQKMPLHPGTKTVEEVFMLRKIKSKTDKNKQPSFHNGRQKFKVREKLDSLGMRDAIDPRSLEKVNSIIPDDLMLDRPATAFEINELHKKCEKVLKRLSELESSQSKDQTQVFTTQKYSRSKRPNTVESSRLLRGAEPVIIRNQLRLFEEAIEDKSRSKKKETTAIPKHLFYAIDEIKDTLEELDRVTTTNNSKELSVREEHAAILIAKIIRGFICRAKYKRAQQAVRRWNKRNGAAILMDRYSSFQIQNSEIMKNVLSKVNGQKDKVKKSHFTAMADYIRGTRGDRERVDKAAKILTIQIQLKLVRRIFDKWADEATGPNSKKNLAKKQKERYEAARKKLEEEQENIKKEQLKESVTRKKIIDELRRDAAEKIFSRRNYMCKNIHFKAWHRDAMFQLNQWNRRAKKFRFKHVVPLYFDAWKESVEKMQREAAVNKEWRRNRFQQKHNVQSIENFWRVKMLVNSFKVWNEVAILQGRIRRKFRDALNKRKKKVIDIWISNIKLQLQIKKICIQEWKSQCITMRAVPFKRWYVWVSNRKKTRESQDFLCNAFIRRRKRLCVTHVFRIWKHQAVYGKTDGMFSRAELIEALKKAKQHVLSMEVMSSQAKDTIEELQIQLKDEQERSQQLKIIESNKNEEILERTFMQEKLEAEIIRLQSIVDSVSLIHPGTIRRLIDESTESNETEKIEKMGFTKATRNAAATKKIGKSSPSNDSNKDDPLVSDSGAERKQQRFARLPMDKRPQSAREKTTTMYEEPIGEAKKNIEKVVWVTQEDSQTVLRSEWARDMLNRYDIKNNDAASEEDEDPEKNEKMQNRINEESKDNLEVDEKEKYKRILSFVLSGTLDSLDEPDGNEIDEERKGLPKFKEGSLNWNDFIQCMTTAFPLRHPANLHPKDEINKRINLAKVTSRKKRSGKKEPSGIYRES